MNTDHWHGEDPGVSGRACWAILHLLTLSFCCLQVFFLGKMQGKKIKYKCTPEFIIIVWQLHIDMLTRVQDNGETSSAFSISPGVKQGSMLALTLFSPAFSTKLKEAFKDSDKSAGTTFYTDGFIQPASSTCKDQSKSQGDNSCNQQITVVGRTLMTPSWLYLY